MNFNTELYREPRQGFYETCGEVWSRELKKLKDYKFVGMLDADCEVLDKNLFADMSELLHRNKKAAVVSTDFSGSDQYYDSYTNQHGILMKRFHTWCCLYRRSALQLNSSFYYYEEKSAAGTRIYDHASFLQHELEKHGLRGISLGERHHWRFLHYGQFAKNRSLRGLRLRAYRLARMGIHNGFYHVLPLRGTASALSNISCLIFKILGFERFDSERMTLIPIEESFRLGYCPNIRKP